MRVLLMLTPKRDVNGMDEGAQRDRSVVALVNSQNQCGLGGFSNVAAPGQSSDERKGAVEY